MFWHSYKYSLKALLKNRMLVFWTVAFPFILALLFNMAFARLHDLDVFEPFDIAVVNDEEYKKDEIFSAAFKTLGEGDERLFNIELSDIDHAEELLNDDKIAGYVFANGDKKEIKIKENGTNQTVLKMVVEQVSQSAKMIDDIALSEIAKNAGQMVDVAAIYQNAVKIVSETEPNIKDESHVMNIVSVEFFSLIAMACMQGAMLSCEMMNRCMPNITNRGKRVAVAPTRKGVIVSSNLLAGYTLLLASLIALIFFTRYILGVEYGDNIPLICLLAALGSLTATMLGMFLSVILKTRESAKNVIVVLVTMVGSLFAGMFGGMKFFFDEMLPFVNKISPVGLITDGYYSLYYYEDLTRFWINAGTLVLISVILFALSIKSLRRQRYDSI